MSTTFERYVGHAHLKEFARSRVNLDEEIVRKYRDQASRVRTRLDTYIDENPDYALVKMLNSGSIAKGTAISTTSDIDLAVYIKAAEAPSDADLVRWLRERLIEAYAGVLDPDQFEPQDHCVTIKYKSYDMVDIDVVPVLYEGEAQNVGYLITKTTGARVKTSVSLHIDFIGKRKTMQPIDFATVVRLLKWWKREQAKLDSNFRFKSFAIELICAHLADHGVSFSDYPAAVTSFFAYIVETELSARIAFNDYYGSTELPSSTGSPIEIFDPVNAANNIMARYAGADRERIVSAAQDALDAITDAAYATTPGRALEDWQIVFGPSFKGAS